MSHKFDTFGIDIITLGLCITEINHIANDILKIW